MVVTLFTWPQAGASSICCDRLPLMHRGDQSLCCLRGSLTSTSWLPWPHRLGALRDRASLITLMFSFFKFDIFPRGGGGRACGIAFQVWGSPRAASCQESSHAPPPQGDGPSRLWPAGILRSHGPQWGQEGLWRPRAYLPGPASALAQRTLTVGEAAAPPSTPAGCSPG